MSRRQVTTIQVQVKLRLPPGATIRDGLQFIHEGMTRWQASMNNDEPMKQVDIGTRDACVKLEKKETVYL